MVQALGRRDDSRGCNDVENLLGETESLTNAAREEQDCTAEKRTRHPKEHGWERDWSEQKLETERPVYL